MNSKKFIFGVAVAIVCIGVCFYFFMGSSKPDETASTEAPIREQAAIAKPPSLAKSTPSPHAKTTPEGHLENAAIVATDEYIRTHPNEISIRDYHTPIKDAIKTPIGHKVVYLFSQDDIPITGMHITFDVNNDNEVTRVQNSYLPVDKADTTPGQEVDELVKNVVLPFSAKPKLDENGAPSVLYLRQGTNQPELAYVVPVTNPKKPTQPFDVILRQSDGQILGRTGGGRR